MVSLETPLENGEGMKPSPLVELNANMLGRDVERMLILKVSRLIVGKGGFLSTPAVSHLIR